MSSEGKVKDLTGKVAVVTGAASGIGLAITEALCGRGARVAMADIESQPLEEAAARLAGGGAEVVPVITDVSDLESVRALRERVEDDLGATELLFNNAGVAGGGLIWQIPHAVWEWVLAANLWGVINGIEVFVPGMVERDGGHVVNTASVAGLLAAPAMGPYTASKHAVVGISETLRHDLQLAGSHVQVSVLCPGFVRTRIGDSDRNRRDVPDSEQADPLAEVFAPLIRQAIEGGIAPEIVAAHVLAAIDGDRFWILTHEEFGAMITERFGAAVRGENPPASIIT
jgi:NAD(P)-dependent dehydrogenase (short-subunit alcohol dehydrogenase family)